jgi:hypothetical protein
MVPSRPHCGFAIGGDRPVNISICYSITAVGDLGYGDIGRVSFPQPAEISSELNHEETKIAKTVND